MNHLFVPYEIALLSKEKGFDEPCFAHYRDKDSLIMLSTGIAGIRYSEIEESPILAPLNQQVTDWLDTKGIFINATHDKIGYTNEEDSTPLTVLKWEYHITKIDALSTYNFSHIKAECNFKTKREALNKAIEEALKLI